jgi:hypothetical protein
LFSEVVRAFHSKLLLRLGVKVDGHSSLGVVVCVVEGLVGARVLGSKLDVTAQLLVPASGSVRGIRICREREARSRIGAVSVTEHHIAELVGSVADMTVKAVTAVGGVDAKDGSTVATG